MPGPAPRWWRAWKPSVVCPHQEPESGWPWETDEGQRDRTTSCANLSTETNHLRPPTRPTPPPTPGSTARTGREQPALIARLLPTREKSPPSRPRHPRPAAVPEWSSICREDRELELLLGSFLPRGPGHVWAPDRKPPRPARSLVVASTELLVLARGDQAIRPQVLRMAWVEGPAVADGQDLGFFFRDSLRVSHRRPMTVTGGRVVSASVSVWASVRAWASVSVSVSVWASVSVSATPMSHYQPRWPNRPVA